MDQRAKQLTARSDEVRAQLAEHAVLGKFVDLSLPIPKPFIGSGDIKLVVIGQDPTVQKIKSRSGITTVLNLNKSGSLTRYLDRICNLLGIYLYENLYATNACKNFFVDPPTSIQKNHKVNVMQESAPYWLPLLQDEVAQFPQATIISLGEPVLSLLVKGGGSRLMKYYWAHSSTWELGNRRAMSPIISEFSTIGRKVFPFPHQPSIRKQFYSDNLSQYIDFVRTEMA